MLYKEINHTAHEIRVGATNHCFEQCDFLRKEAAAESVEYFNKLKPKKDHLYFLVVAMTAGEFFGSNRNGDYFKEKDLKEYYKIFENSGVFWNHDNKDPSKSFGNVLKAFYNDKMHRIEIVIEVPIDKSRYLKDYITDGKPISVSMGLNTPTETCSICGHVTRGSYANRCEHLKFMMNTVLHDGKKVYAISGTPLKLFDISFVFRPADRTAYAMLTKSASYKELGLAKIQNDTKRMTK
jgi:hypothetical protein